MQAVENNLAQTKNHYFYDETEFENKTANLLKVLSEREEYVIKHRFGIGQTEKETLEKIGHYFSITRERVRQIENNALKKLQRIVGRTQSNFINEYAVKLITNAGGAIIERNLIAELLKLFKNPEKIDINYTRLSLSAETSIKGYGNAINLYPYWALNEITTAKVKFISDFAYKFLKKKKEVMAYEDFANQVLEKIPDKSIKKELLFSILEIDKRVKMLDEGVGLKEWRDIHPRTLRDKIYYVLRNVHAPLHFVDISNKIAEANFDYKTINTQAVHNELIRCDNFVLIGRGLYALKEWGYEHGTITDIIANILREKGPLRREEIIKEVLKKRIVKRISILVTLKNKPQFQRVGRDTYKLA